MIAGDRNGTGETVVVAGDGMNFVERRGDGTVLLRSASLNNPAGAFLSFTTHMKIFNDENVKDKLETILFRCEMAFKNFNNEIPTVKIARSFAVPNVLPVDFVTAEIIDSNTSDPHTFAVRGDAQPDAMAETEALQRVVSWGAPAPRQPVRGVVVFRPNRASLRDGASPSPLSVARQHGSWPHARSKRCRWLGSSAANVA
jgi:hypothetical protein